MARPARKTPAKKSASGQGGAKSSRTAASVPTRKEPVASDQAVQEVEAFERSLDALSEYHKTTGEIPPWRDQFRGAPPTAPARSTRHEAAAREKLDAWTPGFFTRIFGRTEKAREPLVAAVEHARKQDELEYREALRRYERELAMWQERKAFAGDVLEGNEDAMVKVLKDLAPFRDIPELGGGFRFNVHDASFLEISWRVRDFDSVPEDMKTLTPTGKLSVKPMLKSRRFEIYRDHVCSGALRVARETLALLPTVQTVLIHAEDEQLNPRNGHVERMALLSAAFHRSAIEAINFLKIQPSDAMENFNHRMKFKKTSEPGTVSRLSPKEAGWEPAARPKEPAPEKTHPGARWERSWKDFLGYRVPDAEGGYRVPVNELALVLGLPAREQHTAVQSAALCERIETQGHVLVPDARHDGLKYPGTLAVGLLQVPQGVSTRDTAAFLGASTLLHLCVIVAAADGGGVRADDLESFRKFIERQLGFSDWDHRRLKLLEQVLRDSPDLGEAALKRVVDRMSRSKRPAVAQMLVHIAVADGKVTREEEKALARIFEALELPKEDLDKRLKAARKAASKQEQTDMEVVSQSSQGTKGFQLDMDRIKSIAGETSEVIGILAEVMSAPEADTVPSVPSSKSQSSTVSKIDLDGPWLDLSTPQTWMEGLEPANQKFLMALCRKRRWARAAFQELAREHHLMPSAALDRINEWADEELGDFFIEGEDPYELRADLVPE